MSLPPKDIIKPSVDVVQIGARERYAVPQMIHEVGMLRKLHTDLYLGAGSSLHRLRPLLRFTGQGRRLLNRVADLPADKIEAYNLIGLQRVRRLRNAKAAMDRMEVHRSIESRLATSVLKRVKEMPDVFVGFRGAETLFEQVQGRSVCVLDQIDGGIHEVNVVKEEQRNHIDWVPGRPDWLQAEEDGTPFWMDIEGERLKREWDHSDLIVCNSSWSVECLTSVGVDRRKLRIIPLAFEKSGPRPEVRLGKPGEITVGYLGTLTLRKGIHHLLEAARLASEEVQVKVICAGPSEIQLERLDRFQDLVDYRGSIPRSEIEAFFEECDLLALPSVSEGFGIVQLEAMSHGLPVIASERTGDVVISGTNGIRTKVGDIEGLATAMITLARSPEQRRSMGEAALRRVHDFSRARVRAQWLEVLQEGAENTFASLRPN